MLLSRETVLISYQSPRPSRWTPSAKPSLTAVGTVTTALPDPFTVSYCMSMVRLWIAVCVLLGGAALRVCVTGLASFDVSQNPELAMRMAFAVAGG